MSKALWIDFDNSPHVPLFAPIIRHYRDRGVEVILTARDHSQTIELLELHGFGGTYTVVGSHYGKSKINKVRGLLVRATQLASHINKSQKPISVAVSHGSRSMVLAARWLKIPVVTMYDYEFTETGIFNRFSDLVLVPDRVPDEVLDEIKLPQAKRRKYPGIKEELYVREFRPDVYFREDFIEPHAVLEPDFFGALTVLAVLRPPARSANYHSEKSEVLFDDLLRFLLNAPGVFTVVVPRTKEDADQITSQLRAMPNKRGSWTVTLRAVDGLQLAYASDLLISGGGTMNREAALLGVPVYSIFAGRQGALDRQMEAEGSITFIRDTRDLSKIVLSHRDRQKPSALTDRVAAFVIDAIDPYLE
jgi:predicted glycosyltransferase